MVELLLSFSAAVNAKYETGNDANECATRRAQCAHALDRVCMRGVPPKLTVAPATYAQLGRRRTRARATQAGCDAVKQPSIVLLG